MKLADVELWVQAIATTSSIATREEAEFDALAISKREPPLKRKRLNRAPSRSSLLLTPPGSGSSGAAMSRRGADGATLPSPKKARLGAAERDGEEESADELAYDTPDIRPSNDDDDDNYGGAREREDDQGEEADTADATPRAPRRRLVDVAHPAAVSPSSSPRHRLARRKKPPASEKTTSSSSARSESTTGSRSATSSPRKKLRNLSLAPEPVKHRSLTLGVYDDMPPALTDICTKLENIAAGFGVLAKSSQEVFANHSNPIIQRLAKNNIYFSSAATDADAGDDDRGYLGDTPSPDQVLRILYRAVDCDNLQSSEIAWNFEVHAPLLSMALRPDPDKISPDMVSQPCDYVACHSVRIIKEYLHGFIPEKLVDFCLFLNPAAMVTTHDNDNDSSDAAAASLQIDRVRTRLPEQMINHAVCDSLAARPIALTIETKKAEEGLINAKLQVGVWHAAQWNFLGSVVVADGAFDEGKGKLEFLPAIIVEGHNWSFAATTRKGATTTLWSKQFIGSTTNPLGIYKIVAALRYLQKWAVDEYWPWFREAVLGMPPSPQDEQATEE